MEILETLRAHGLFDAKVPRYTSYPPANRFQPDIGRQRQSEWLAKLPPDDPVSIYVHIPFCRRLCWFCACRTQGTKTLGPVADYLTFLLREIETIGRSVPSGLQMGRLHLGGGTPTLLSAEQMDTLLTALHRSFSPTVDFEFSVEIDPTEASAAVLDVLCDWGMTRASIGVQDFAPEVQKAIGRIQSFEETQSVVAYLRKGGVRSLNVDLLYGLPFQTGASINATLDRIICLQPDRLALYGYAHVPHISKRQVMISELSLPDAEARYHLARLAGDRLGQLGLQKVGIDHFARPNDSLAVAARHGNMRRNFQGYTDDPCQSLIGLGASAISRFDEGYVQNAVATAAYMRLIEGEELAGQKGYHFDQKDRALADVIEELMCYRRIRFDKQIRTYPDQSRALTNWQGHLLRAYGNVMDSTGTEAVLRRDYVDLSRVIAAELDLGLAQSHVHSLAI